MSTDVEAWNDGLSDGLEDLNQSDLRVPRLTMTHGSDATAGHFKDGLSGGLYPTLDAVVLGLVRGRVMWKPSVDDNDTPLCKSTNYTEGWPTIGKPSQNDNFPWNAAGWQPSDFQADADGRIQLPCASCRLKEWRSHPDGKKTWCAEQYHLVMLYAAEGDTPSTLAIFTCQRSSIAVANNYLANFKRMSMPAYSKGVKLSLKAEKRGQNTYYVPVFQMKDDTDQSDWPVYSQTYRDVREFLTKPPALRDAAGNIIDATAVATENTMPASQPVQQTQPVPETQPVPATVVGSTARDADDDLPF